MNSALDIRWMGPNMNPIIRVGEAYLSPAAGNFFIVTPHHSS